MKILITGSSGFIGFHLAKKLLEKGHKIHDIKPNKDGIINLEEFNKTINEADSLRY